MRWAHRFQGEAPRCALVAVLIACSLGATFARRAGADGGGNEDKAVLDARHKFRQAISLQTGGDWAGALALFRDVALVKNTPQVQFNVAICEEKLGQLVQALGDYQLAAVQARADGDLQVAGAVEGKLSTLQERIPKVIIQRDEHATFAKISIDHVEVGATALGQPMPVDPGGHTVSGESKGYVKFEKAIDVGERQSITVQVQMVPLPVNADPAASPAADRGPTQAAPKARSPLPFVVGGVGAASLVASGVFFALRAGTISDLDAACPTRQNCSPSLEGKASTGRTYTTVSLVTLGVGVAGLGAGAAMFFLSPSQKHSETAVHLVPGAPLADVGASVVGAF